MPKRILFISHSGTRTGSPIVLLNVLRWLRTHTDVQCSVLFWAGGPLLPEFEELAPCRVLYPVDFQNLSLPRQLWNRLSVRPDDNPRDRSRLERRVRAAAQHLSAAVDERWMRTWRECDLVYANSVGSARALRAIAPTAPLLAHVHESGYSLHHTESPADVARFIGGGHPLIAASEAVKTTLVDEFQVKPNRVHVVRSFITLPPSLPGIREIPSLRHELGISTDAFVVGGVGTIEWRKGPDLFVQLARRLRALRPETDIHFVWVGAERPAERYERIRLDLDVKNSDLADRVHLVGARTDPATFYRLFDVFALTSRADPFPLVALEAAAAGRPVVCFTGGGGMPEFVSAGAGFAVPYLGVDEMAARVLELHDDPDLRASIGSQAAREVQRSYTAEAVIPRIAQLMFATAR